MKVFAETNIGNKRSTNQDTFRYGDIAENVSWVMVCDGMGGVNGGDIASNTAADVIAEEILKLPSELPDEEIRGFLIECVNKANTAVFNKSAENEELKGMGTTVVLALFRDQLLHLVHVGDSRAYLIANDAAEQITEDHSLVQDLVNSGVLTKEEAKMHPHKNIITRSVGVHSMVEAEYNCYKIVDGDIILICSDGFSDLANDEDLYDIYTSSDEDSFTTNLINFALNAGGHDNITVLAVYC